MLLRKNYKNMKPDVRKIIWFQDNSNLFTDNIFIFACIYLFYFSRFPNIYAIFLKVTRKRIGTFCFEVVVKNSVWATKEASCVQPYFRAGLLSLLTADVVSHFLVLVSAHGILLLLLNISCHSTVNNLCRVKKKLKIDLKFKYI